MNVHRLDVLSRDCDYDKSMTPRWRLCQGLCDVYTIQQMSIKLLANVFKIHVLMLDVCWTFSGSCKHPIILHWAWTAKFLNTRILCALVKKLKGLKAREGPIILGLWGFVCQTAVRGPHSCTENKRYLHLL